MPIAEFTGSVVEPPPGPAPTPQGPCPFVFNTGQELTAVVGERVLSRLTLTPGVSLRASNWTVDGCEPVGDYVATNVAAQKTRLTPPPPLSRDYAFHFTRAGTATLTVAITVYVTCAHGTPAEYTREATVTIQVIAPQLEDCVARTNWPTYGPTYVGDREDMKVSLGEHGAPGFSVTAYVKATSPEMAGGWVRDLQTVLMARIVDGGLVWSGEEVLDGSVPYSEVMRQVPAVGRAHWFAEDTPSYQFPKTRRQVQVRAVYRFYLQYRAPAASAIWVTLARWDWYWNIQMENDPTEVPPIPWHLSRSDFAYKTYPDHTMRGAPPGWNLPEWQDTVGQVEARGGPRAGAKPRIDETTQSLVQAAMAPGLTAEPTTGPWTPEEGQPPRHDDQHRIQTGRQLVMFDPPPPEPYDPRHPVDPQYATRQRVAARLGIALGPDVVRPDRRYWLAWSPLETVRDGGYENAQVLPQDLRCEGLDIRPLPERSGVLQVLRLWVAPFCWGGDQAYWELYAHGPLEGPDDFRMAGYERTVRALAQQAGCPVVHGRQLDAGTVEVVFRGMPPMDIVSRIAMLPQTARVLNYFGPLPVPYPDDM